MAASDPRRALSPSTAAFSSFARALIAARSSALNRFEALSMGCLISLMTLLSFVRHPLCDRPGCRTALECRSPQRRTTPSREDAAEHARFVDNLVEKGVVLLSEALNEGSPAAGAGGAT